MNPPKVSQGTSRRFFYASMFLFYQYNMQIRLWILSSLLLLGAGCSHPLNISQNEQAGPFSFSKNQAGWDKVDQNEEVKKSVYQQWVIPSDTVEYNLVSSPTVSKDCGFMLSGYTAGGDLLSTLIVDEQARSILDLQVFTPEYLIELERSIVHETQTQFSQDFYAFYVCHLSDEIDIAAGYQSVPSYGLGDAPTLAIRQKGHISLYQDIQLIDQTATGAESSVCDAELEDDRLLWTCFLGFEMSNGVIAAQQMREWTIPLSNQREVSVRDFSLDI